jgi:hypothetical protein
MGAKTYRITLLRYFTSSVKVLPLSLQHHVWRNLNRCSRRYPRRQSLPFDLRRNSRSKKPSGKQEVQWSKKGSSTRTWWKERPSADFKYSTICKLSRAWSLACPEHRVVYNTMASRLVTLIRVCGIATAGCEHCQRIMNLKAPQSPRPPPLLLPLDKSNYL